MRKLVFPSSIAMIGVVLMAVGIATTYVALGQETEQENPAAVVEPTLTPTVMLEDEAVPAGEQSRSANAGKPHEGHGREHAPGQQRGQSDVAQEIQPTIAAPVVNVTPADVSIPQAAPSPVVEPPSDANVPEAVSPTEVLAPDANTLPTVLATVPSIASPVEVTPVDVVIEVGAEGTERVSDSNAISPAAVPTTQSIEPAVEAIPVATVVEVDTEVVPQSDLIDATPAAVGTLEGEALPVQEATSAEVASEPEATEQIVIEEAVEAEILSSFVLGQVDSQARASVTLTLPTGQIVSQAADEQGLFQFEVIEQGEYHLVASAPGSLSSQLSFNLDEGQQVELPLTHLSPGDVNQDSHIDLSDIVLVAANYDGPALVAQADLNGDSWIDISDLTIIGAKFGLSGPLPWDSR